MKKTIYRFLIFLLVYCFFFIIVYFLFNHYASEYYKNSNISRFRNLSLLLENSILLSELSDSLELKEVIATDLFYNEKLIIIKDRMPLLIIDNDNFFEYKELSGIVEEIFLSPLNSAISKQRYFNIYFIRYFKKVIINNNNYTIIILDPDDQINKVSSMSIRYSFFISAFIIFLVIGVYKLSNRTRVGKQPSVFRKEKAILSALSDDIHTNPFIIVTKTGIIETINPSALEILSTNKDSITGRYLFDFLKEKTEFDFKKFYDITFLDKKEIIISAPDNKKLYIEFFVRQTFIQSSKELIYLIILKNLTEQKQINEIIHKELSKSKALSKFSELLSSINDPEVITKYVIDNTKNLISYDSGTLLIADNNFLRCYYTNDPEIERVKDKFKLRIGEGLSGLVAETRQGMFLNNTTGSTIIATIPDTRDVQEKLLSVPLITKTKLLGVLTFSRIEGDDFTDDDLHLMELFASQVATVLDNASLMQRLSDSEKTYRSLINEAKAGIFILQTKMITFVNSTFSNLLDIAQEKLIGEQILTFIEESEQAKFASKLSKFLLNNKTDFQQLRMKRSDGSIITVELTLSLVHWENKLAIMGMVTDISEKISLYNQLMQTQKLESVGTLAGGIAHDFKNILAGILGASEMLMINAEKESKTYNYATMIKKSAERGSALAHRILNFSRKDNQLELFNLNDIISEVIEIVTHTFSKNIKLNSSLAPESLIFEGDAVKIQQCVLNIAVNARDAMEQGGTLTITSQKIPLSDIPDKLNPDHYNYYALINITDTGTGIDEEIQKKIFEPFFTTKSKEKGTGLGLSTTISILSEIHGLVDMKSKLGFGTTFSLYFPLSEKDIIHSKTSETIRSNSEGKRILLVDDEEIVLEVAKELLEEIGYEIIAVNNSVDALDMLERDSSFDIALLDRIMPFMDGIQLFDEIHKKYPKIKVIISSGLAEDKIIQDKRNQGLAGYITKPYRLEDIIKLLRSV